MHQLIVAITLTALFARQRLVVDRNRRRWLREIKRHTTHGPLRDLLAY